MQLTRQIGTIVRLTLLLVGAVFMLLPFAWMLSTSLKPEAEVFSLSLLPSQILWSNYVEAWSVAPFGRLFLNSTVVATIATALTVYVNSMAAFAFAVYRFRGRDRIFLAFLATMMIPGQVTMIPVFLMVRDLGWINSYAGVVIPGIAQAFGTFLVRQYMLSLPHELFEAARMDGCSELGLFHRIALPLSGPVLAALAIFSFVGEWNDFLWPLIVLNRPSMFTLQIGLQRFIGQYDITYSHMMAMSLLSLAPIIIVFLFFQRYLVQAIAVTGSKQ